jgi:quercetin dioxygenase-like cupin family protein
MKTQDGRRTMESVSLDELVDEHLQIARGAHSGRSAHTVHGGHDHFLRQTLIALAAGHELGEHDSPGEATLQVLRGHVRLRVGEDAADGSAGDYLVLPAARHSLQAIDDSAVLLTVLADR